MSTERTDYIIYGFDISNADMTAELYNKLENQNQLEFLVDGMGGEYNILGFVIGKFEEFEGVSLTSIRINENDKYRSMEKKLELILTKLDEKWIFHSMLPEIHIVTHWH